MTRQAASRSGLVVAPADQAGGAPRQKLALGEMGDDELDELILGRLRQRRGNDGATGDRTLSAAYLAVFFNEPELRVQRRLIALAAEGRVRESAAAPIAG